MFTFLAFAAEPGSLAHKLSIVVLGSAPLSWALAQYSYRKVDWFRLRVDAELARRRNSSITWSATCEWPILESSIWDSVSEALREAADSGGILSEEFGNLVVVSKGVTIRLSLAAIETDEEGFERDLRVIFPAIAGPIRTWEDRIEEAVVPLLHHIGDIVRGQHAGSAKFAVTVGFEDRENPYFGYFVSRLERDAIRSFDVDYFEDVATDRVLVKVRQNSLGFVTSNLDTLRRLSVKFLGLRTPGT